MCQALEDPPWLVNVDLYDLALSPSVCLLVVIVKLSCSSQPIDASLRPGRCPAACDRQGKLRDGWLACEQVDGICRFCTAQQYQ